MQANKDQDWYADDAFWDDAWADMNTRLDAAPDRRRAGPAWWPFLLAGAGAFVLVIMIAAGIIFDRDDVETTAPVPSAREAVMAGSDRMNNNPVAAATPTKASTSKDQVEILSSRTKGGNTVTPKKSDSVSKSAAVRYERTKGLPKIIKPVPEEERSVVNVRTSSNGTAPDPKTNGANNAPPVSDPNDILDDQNSVTASLKIAPLAIGQLTDYPEYSLPSVQPQRFRHPNPLSLEVGFTSSFNAQQPGFLAGVGYRVMGGKRLSFPLSLSYRLDEINVKDSPLDEARANDVTTGSPAADNTDVLLIPRSISTTALEMETGLAWAATPRLRLTSGLSAAYQLRALVNFEGQSNSSFNGQAEFTAGMIYSLRLDRGEEFLSALSQDGISPDFNRWAFRAYLGATYDLTPRLGVNLNASRLLAQPDRAGVIGLRTGRLEVGVGYRLW